MRDPGLGRANRFLGAALVLAARLAAGAEFSRFPRRVWFAMAGAYLGPVAAWFAGFDPPWPAAWPAAAALSFSGSWAGFGLARLLERRRPRQARREPPEENRRARS